MKLVTLSKQTAFANSAALAIFFELKNDAQKKGAFSSIFIPLAEALSNANKATQALETAQDTTTAVKSAEAIAKTDEVAKAANASDATKATESKGPSGDGGGGLRKRKHIPIQKIAQPMAKIKWKKCGKMKNK